MPHLCAVREVCPIAQQVKDQRQAEYCRLANARLRRVPMKASHEDAVLSEQCAPVPEGTEREPLDQVHHGRLQCRRVPLSSLPGRNLHLPQSMHTTAPAPRHVACLGDPSAWLTATETALCLCGSPQ